MKSIFRFLALLLSLSLSFPNPTFALREGQEDFAVRQIEQILKKAGLEAKISELAGALSLSPDQLRTVAQSLRVAGESLERGIVITKESDLSGLRRNGILLERPEASQPSLTIREVINANAQWLEKSPGVLISAAVKMDLDRIPEQFLIPHPAGSSVMSKSLHQMEGLVYLPPAAGLEDLDPGIERYETMYATYMQALDDQHAEAIGRSNAFEELRKAGQAIYDRAKPETHRAIATALMDLQDALRKFWTERRQQRALLGDKWSPTAEASLKDRMLQRERSALSALLSTSAGLEEVHYMILGSVEQAIRADAVPRRLAGILHGLFGNWKGPTEPSFGFFLNGPRGDAFLQFRMHEALLDTWPERIKELLETIGVQGETEWDIRSWESHPPLTRTDLGEIAEGAPAPFIIPLTFRSTGERPFQAGLEERGALEVRIDDTVEAVKAIVASGQRVALLIDPSVTNLSAAGLEDLGRRLRGMSQFPFVSVAPLTEENEARYTEEGYLLVQVVPDRSDASLSLDVVYLQRVVPGQPIPNKAMPAILTAALAAWKKAQGQQLLDRPLRVDVQVYVNDVRFLSEDEVWQVLTIRFA